jgi:acetylornithine deacetylase
MEQELRALPPNPRFDPPYNTLQVTQITGGTASNIVPVPCWFGWEVRRLPGFDVNPLDEGFRRFAADPESGIVPWALKLAGQNDTYAVCYATEASRFQTGGAPAVVIGPGDIAQAHTPNEFIAVSELEKCLAFLGRVADWAET